MLFLFIYFLLNTSLDPMNVKFDTKNIARAVSTDSTDVCKHRKLL